MKNFKMILPAMLMFFAFGCAGFQPQPPVNSFVLTKYSSNYSRNVEGLIKDVKSKTEEYMVDKAAVKYRDKIIKQMREEAEPKLNYVVDDNEKKLIAERIVTLIENSLRENHQYLYKIEDMDTRYSLYDKIANSDVKINDIVSPENGSFGGSFRIGEFFKISSAYRDPNPFREETFIFKLSGKYSFGDNSLKVDYAVQEIDHLGSKGITATLNRNGLITKLDEIPAKAISAGPQKIDNIYSYWVVHSTHEISNRLRSRIDVLPQKDMEIKEVSYNVDFETAVARI